MPETAKTINAPEEREKRKGRDIKKEIGECASGVLIGVRQLLNSYGYNQLDIDSMAPDLTQIALEKGLKSSAKYDPNRSVLKTWLINIARTTIIDDFRRKQRQKRDMGNAVDFETALSKHPSPDKRLSDPLLKKRIEAAIAELSPDFQEILRFFYLNNLDYKEIAKRLGIAVSTVFTRLNRARNQLKEILKHRGVDVENI